MTTPRCERITFEELTDYAAGALPDSQAATLEEHLFSCGDCAEDAAVLDALIRGIGGAVRSAEIGGFVTDAVLNRLSREGVRMRTFTLSPGAIVPCAVWEHDELMALRLRGDFGRATAFTLSQRVGGNEVSRTAGEVAAGEHGEIIFATPAAWLRDLPAVAVELLLTATVDGEERQVGSYTLVHGGLLRR
ncbi:MAG TPA: zf-HC2 domain-containing protein [Vicinamibacterales bacterium]